jgi:hypothetical protein
MCIVFEDLLAIKQAQAQSSDGAAVAKSMGGEDRRGSSTEGLLRETEGMAGGEEEQQQQQQQKEVEKEGGSRWKSPWEQPVMEDVEEEDGEGGFAAHSEEDALLRMLDGHDSNINRGISSLQENFKTEKEYEYDEYEEEEEEEGEEEGGLPEFLSGHSLRDMSELMLPVSASTGAGVEGLWGELKRCADETSVPPCTSPTAVREHVRAEAARRLARQANALKYK